MKCEASSLGGHDVRSWRLVVVLFVVFRPPGFFLDWRGRQVNGLVGLLGGGGENVHRVSSSSFSRIERLLLVGSGEPWDSAPRRFFLYLY